MKLEVDLLELSGDSIFDPGPSITLGEYTPHTLPNDKFKPILSVYLSRVRQVSSYYLIFYRVLSQYKSNKYVMKLIYDYSK